jgi:hypothetical protein
MRMMGVYRAPDHFTIEFLPEIFSLVRESNNFSGTHKGEIERIEKKQQVFILIVIERYVFELVVEETFTFKVRGEIFNSSFHELIVNLQNI